MFFAWEYVRVLGGLTLILIGSVAAVWKAQSRRKLIAIPIYVSGTVVGLLAAGFLFLFSLTVGCHTYSVPLYSPNRKIAARVWDFDQGAIGGHSDVELYSSHGFVTDLVFDGQWKTVVPKDVRWVSDNDLEIHFEYGTPFCEGTKYVKVHCIGPDKVNR